MHASELMWTVCCDSENDLFPEGRDVASWTPDLATSPANIRAEVEV